MALKHEKVVLHPSKMEHGEPWSGDHLNLIENGILAFAFLVKSVYDPNPVTCGQQKAVQAIH